MKWFKDMTDEEKYCLLEDSMFQIQKQCDCRNTDCHICTLVERLRVAISGTNLSGLKIHETS